MTSHLRVGGADGLGELFPESRVFGPVDISLSSDALQFLTAELSAISRRSERLLIASSSGEEFSWELANRLMTSEPRLSAADVVDTVGDVVTIRGRALTVVLAPSLLAEPEGLERVRESTDCAVILLRKDVTRVGDVEALARRLDAAAFRVSAVAIIEAGHRRWRKWRRFARTYGVLSSAERPWPRIDVLDQETRRTSRSRRSEPGG